MYKEPLRIDWNPKQIEAKYQLAGTHRHDLLVGGSRSGKTFVLIDQIVCRAVKAPGSRHFIIRLRFNAAKESIWLDTLPKVLQMRWPGLHERLYFNDSLHYCRFDNGSEIWIAGLDEKERTEKILGKEAATIFFNECSQLPYASVTTALTRLAQKVPLHQAFQVSGQETDYLRNKAFYDLNPTGTNHWTYQQFIQKRSPGTQKLLSAPDDYRYMYLNPKDNAKNIDPEYIKSMLDLPERQRYRFFEGRYQTEIDGALWTLELIDKYRIAEAQRPERFRRIVIAVDPSGTAGPDDIHRDAIGLVAAGVTEEGHGYLLEDRTGHHSPETWGRFACEMFHQWRADRVIGEQNFGGDMVRAIVHGHDRNVPYKQVVASRGKTIRAEPVAALYEQGRIHHVGNFGALEDELTNFTTAGYIGDRSPNRADAAIHAFTELMVNRPAEPRIRTFDLGPTGPPGWRPPRSW